MSYKLNPITGKLDYFEAAGAAANGLPTGGSAGEVLTKQSGTDYDAAWEPGGGGSSPSPSYHLTDVASTTTTYSWIGTSLGGSGSIVKTVLSGNNREVRTISTAADTYANRATASYTTSLTYSN